MGRGLRPGADRGVNMPVFGLIDGNSFYCSCQRAFDASIRNSPVVVLSNNDGCAIARTAEAKQLGIKMGEPWHLARRRPALQGVRWYSSNYPLYADMSRRMFQVLEYRVPRVEPYSIDEMFLDLTALPYDLATFCADLRRDVLEISKIPTCIGWGPTKTIAKVANRIAKADPALQGLCDLNDTALRHDWYRRTDIEDVWGIGRKGAERLRRAGIHTIADFVEMDTRAVRNLLTVVGARVQAELQGQSCLPLADLAAPRQGLACTRTFGRPIDNWSDLREAVASYATTAAAKLRRDRLHAGSISVFIRTNPRTSTEAGWYANQQSISIEPTNDTMALIAASLRLLRKIWKPGYRYFKAGVILDALAPAARQGALFSTRDPQRAESVMATMDALNARFGRGTVRPLATGTRQDWRPRQAFLSPAYTTRFEDIMQVHAW
ncbi:Y-family DNA polymerase [Novacetimonas hansenii]|uniref:Y-family DNA polymerase n=1 Tax=Novacetimonas hansenii TaxID=436 RepID=UPI0030B8D570